MQLYTCYFCLFVDLIFLCCRWLGSMPAPSSFSCQQNSHWALMINKTLLTMRGTQSALVLAESEKDRDNYSLNRQSPRWRPHNQDCVCILGSFHRKRRAKASENEEASNKVGKNQSHWANTVAWVTGKGWKWSLKGCISTWNHMFTAELHETGQCHEWWKNGGFSRIIYSKQKVSSSGFFCLLLWSWGDLFVS